MQILTLDYLPLFAGIQGIRRFLSIVIPSFHDLNLYSNLFETFSFSKSMEYQSLDQGDYINSPNFRRWNAKSSFKPEVLPSCDPSNNVTSLLRPSVLPSQRDILVPRPFQFEKK